MRKRKIGAHLSVAGGHAKAMLRIREIGGDCLQIFSSSPRSWKCPDLELLPVEDLRRTARELDLAQVFTHAAYLVNLVSRDEETRLRSEASLGFDLTFDAAIGGAGVIVHPGSRQGRGWSEVKDSLVRSLVMLLDRAPEGTHLLLENSAGQMGKLCSDLSEIRWLLDRLPDDRAAWCFDTCHAFAAGYRLSPDIGYRSSPDDTRKGKPDRGAVEEEIDRLDLWKSLACIHLNDSKDPFGSGRDRHENIGDGQIPEADLGHFLSLTQCATVPLILEVPGLDGKGPDEENILRVKRLLHSPHP